MYPWWLLMVGVFALMLLTEKVLQHIPALHQPSPRQSKPAPIVSAHEMHWRAKTWFSMHARNKTNETRISEQDKKIATLTKERDNWKEGWWNQRECTGNIASSEYQRGLVNGPILMAALQAENPKDLAQ